MKTQKQLLKKLQLLFFGSILLLLILGWLMVKDIIPNLNLFTGRTAILIRTCCLIIFFFCIPFSLYGYSKRIKALKDEPDKRKRIRIYEKESILRISVLSGVAFCILLTATLTFMKEAKTLFLMNMIFYLLCIPGRKQMKRELSFGNEDDENEADGNAGNISPEEKAAGESDDFIPRNPRKRDKIASPRY